MNYGRRTENGGQSTCPGSTFLQSGETDRQANNGKYVNLKMMNMARWRRCWEFQNWHDGEVEHSKTEM